MVMECLEISLPLSIKASSKKYIELIDITISNIVENYNEYLPFRVNLEPEKTRKVIEKIKLLEMEKHPIIIETLMQREIRNSYPRYK